VDEAYQGILTWKGRFEVFELCKLDTSFHDVIKWGCSELW